MGKEKKSKKSGSNESAEIADEEIKLIRELGSGCFGTVWLGECREMQVAVKIPHVQQLSKEDLADLRREIHIMATNPHPNIMRFMGACTVPGKFKIVMELLTGDLEGFLLEGEGNKLSLYKRLKMAKEAALGMNWLHCSEPAIIHRDLKLENLMYAKIENSYSVRVADFGLSCIKPKNIKRLKDDAKGTPLTRAPEIMMGKPFNQKADVYSFGMTLWEIATCKDLFPHHSDYQEFMHCICVEGERPDVTGLLPSLAQLLTDCWHRDPDHRPDFEAINARLDEILVEAAINDVGGRAFWKRNFLKEHSVPFTKFSRAFYRWMRLKMPLDTGEKEASDDVMRLRALKALVCKKDDSNEDSVEICHFGSIIDWFAPMKPAEEGEENILDRMYHTCSLPWFHGDIDLSEAQRRLKGMAGGTFLVRFSRVPGSFTITRLTEDQVTKNARISRNEDYEFYVNADQSYPSLEALIVDLQETLTLTTACPGSRFESMGLEEGLSGYEVIY